MKSKHFSKVNTTTTHHLDQHQQSHSPCEYGRTPSDPHSWWSCAPGRAERAESLDTRSWPDTGACSGAQWHHHTPLKVWASGPSHSHSASWLRETSSLPEVLDVVLHSTEAQGVSQSLVVGQGLGGGAPVHIWNHEENHSSEEEATFGWRRSNTLSSFSKSQWYNNSKLFNNEDVKNKIIDTKMFTWHEFCEELTSCCSGDTLRPHTHMQMFPQE